MKKEGCSLTDCFAPCFPEQTPRLPGHSRASGEQGQAEGELIGCGPLKLRPLGSAVALPWPYQATQIKIDKPPKCLDRLATTKSARAVGVIYGGRSRKPWGTPGCLTRLTRDGDAPCLQILHCIIQQVPAAT